MHMTSLLSLVPPSCMVVSIRDFGNKFAFFSSNMHSQQDFQLTTVFPSNCTEIDILSGISPDNYDEVRERTVSPKLQVSRDSSMSSTKFLVVYHEKIECNNTLNKDVNMDKDSSVLLYKIIQEKAI